MSQTSEAYLVEYMNGGIITIDDAPHHVTRFYIAKGTLPFTRLTIVTRVSWPVGGYKRAVIALVKTATGATWRITHPTGKTLLLTIRRIILA